MLAVMTDPQFARLMKGARPRGRARRPALFGLAEPQRARACALREIIEDGAYAPTARRTGSSASPSSTCSCAGIWTGSPEIVHHPQLAHRDVIQHVASADGDLTLVGSGFRLAHGGGAIDAPPPHIGEHNEAILGEAGYSAAEIAAFGEEGVI